MRFHAAFGRVPGRMWNIAVATSSLIVFAGSAARADQPAEQPEPPGSRRAERLKAMQAIAAAIKVVDEESNATPVELVQEPRFRYFNAETPCYDATLWIWGKRGRPAAALALAAERVNRESPSYWAYELTTLTPSRLRVAGADWEWTPNGAGLEFRAFEDAPLPSTADAGRLRQMRGLARRFDAFGLYNPGEDRRVELRVLPTPIHRYDDPDSGITDGAVFLLAGGTDPEILLLIELASTREGEPRWQYGLNRISAGRLHARLDDREVWSCEALPRRTQKSPYYQLHRPMAHELGDD